MGRVLATPRAMEFLDWEPPQPNLMELRSQYGDARMSDEELLACHRVPREDFEATRAAGRVPTTYEFRDARATDELVEEALRLRRPRYVRVRRPGVDLTLRGNG